MYAPIVIFVYKRLEPLKELLKSLENNLGTSESEIFVFSDSYCNEEEKNQVCAVRKYLCDYKRNDMKFKKITIIESDSHKGLANSVISGVSEVLKKYEKVIVLEDDLVISKYFLEYMNQCLDFYKPDKRIWSVSGYSPYVNEKNNYDRAVYLDYRASSWGWATWKDRWIKIDWDIKDYRKFRRNPLAVMRFQRGGNDLPSMLREQIRGNIDSWAVRWCYNQSKYNMYSVAPIKTLVMNNGFDSDATNCNNETKKKYGEDELSQEPDNWLYDDLEIDKKIANAMRRKNGLCFSVMVRDKFLWLCRQVEKRLP